MDLILLPFLLLILSDVCHSLEMISVDVPKYTTAKSRTSLTCNYDLGNDKLYSVKWYRDGSEFYRYVPGDNPPSQVFNVPWVSVDQRLSNEKIVVLRDLHLKATGSYTCEASSEAPKFKTISGYGRMEVIDTPDTRPLIDGENSMGYRVGDWLDVNCTSSRSHPPAHLKWYINNEMVDQSFVSKSSPIKEAGELFTSKLRLRFQLKRHHFVQGYVRIKCTSTIYSEYFESTELQLLGIGLGEKALESRMNGGPSPAKTGLALGLLTSSMIIGWPWIGIY